MGADGGPAGPGLGVGAQDTIYLCNFRVSVDGEWLCLKELQDVEFNLPDSFPEPCTPSPIEPPRMLLGMIHSIYDKLELY